MTSRTSRRPFVGRALELELLGAAFERARAGESQTVVVAGEAGVGKTRLVEQAGASAAVSGALVLTGASLEHAGEVPFLALAEALRELGQTFEAAAMRELAGDDRAELCVLLPELALEGEVVPGAVGSPGRLFAIVRRLLGRLGEAQPVFLFVDDLQWADVSTRELLAYLAHTLRRERVLLVITVRSDEMQRDLSLRPLLVDLGRRANRLDLLPFGLSEVAAQIAGIVGSVPSLELAEAIHERSSGNALFVEELTAASSSGAGAEVPPAALRDMLLARLETLPPHVRASVELVAVAGRQVRHELLARLEGMSEAELLEALAGAVEHNVLVAGEDGYRFRHPLIQEVAYAQLLPAERRPLHAALACALERAPELSLSTAAAASAEVAWHWSAAGLAEPALRAHVLAGEAALRGHAFAEAAAQFEHALELWTSVADADRPAGLDHVELLARGARAAELAGLHVRAVELWQTACHSLDPTAEPERAATLHRGLATSLWSVGRAEAALAEFEAAAELIATGSPSAEQAATFADLARALAFPARLGEGLARAEAALAIAHAVGSPAEESRAQQALGVLKIVEGDSAGAVMHLERALELARAARVPEATGAPCINLAYVLRESARFEEAIRVARSGLELSREFGLERFDGAFLLGTIAESLVVLGRLDEAEQLINEALALGPTGLAAQSLNLILADAHIVRGRLDEAARQLAGAATPGDGDSLYQLYIELARAQIAVWAGDPDDARAAVARGIATAGAAHQPRLLLSLCATGARAEADRARAAGPTRDGSQAEEAREATNRLQQIVAQHRDGPGATAEWQALGRQFDGECACVEAKPDPSAFADAATLFEQIGSQYAGAYARFREAETRLKTSGSRPIAAKALRAAHAAASTLRSTLLETEITSLATRARIRLSADRTHASARRELPLGLTARELEVLGLLAEGRTDRQIAATLFISIKTAGVHVTHILAKLNVHSRGEAAALAHRLHLLDHTSTSTKLAHPLTES